jgi:hypothetical protein
MKFREIFRFELAYQLRRVSTWVYFVVLFVFGFLIMRAGTPADGVFLNTPAFVAFFTVMGGVIWLLLAGAVAGDAAARDVETRMHPLTYTAPVSKADYLGGRFLAAFVLNSPCRRGSCSLSSCLAWTHSCLGHSGRLGISPPTSSLHCRLPLPRPPSSLQWPYDRAAR